MERSNGAPTGTSRLLMTKRKTFSKFFQLQRNLELMDLTHALLMSLAFSFLSNVVGERAGKTYDFARASTALPHAISAFKSGPSSE